MNDKSNGDYAVSNRPTTAGPNPVTLRKLLTTAIAVPTCLTCDEPVDLPFRAGVVRVQAVPDNGLPLPAIIDRVPLVQGIPGDEQSRLIADTA